MMNTTRKDISDDELEQRIIIARQLRRALRSLQEAQQAHDAVMLRARRVFGPRVTDELVASFLERIAV